MPVPGLRPFVRLETHRTALPKTTTFVPRHGCPVSKPILHSQVNSEGFFAAEDGDLRTQRVLLSDVSTGAARAFLCYLYTADTGLPPQLAPELSSLACRSALFFPFTSWLPTLTDERYQVDGSWEDQGRILSVPFSTNFMPSGDLEQGILIGNLARSGLSQECRGCLKSPLPSHVAFSSLDVMREWPSALASAPPEHCCSLVVPTLRLNSGSSFPGPRNKSG